jgi:hypothetical protein
MRPGNGRRRKAILELCSVQSFQPLLCQVSKPDFPTRRYDVETDRSVVADKASDV